MKKVFLILALLGGVLIVAPSCKKTCDCMNRNTGYSTAYDYEKEGYKNCRELERALINEGKNVSCSRDL